MRRPVSAKSESSFSDHLSRGAAQFFEVFHWMALAAAFRFVAGKVERPISGKVALLMLSNLALVVIFLGVWGLMLRVTERIFPGIVPLPSIASRTASGIASGGWTVSIMYLVYPAIDALASEPPH